MKHILPVLLLFIGALFQGCGADKPQEPQQIDLGTSGMPMPTERLQKLNSRYKIAFLEDGYPGKRLKDGTTYTHPLYGTYILKDYIYQYGRDSASEMYEAIVKLADLCLEKMDVKEGALIFYYEPCEEFGYHERFYSSLAQASYLLPLYNTYLLSQDEKYKQGAQQVMKSLFIPKEQGGVALKNSLFYSIEEDPTQPHGIILNGWLSALGSIKDYYDLSQDTMAYDLLMESLKTLPHVLHHYDSEKYLNSRYHLKGFQQYKLKFSHNQICIKGGYVDNRVLNKNSFSMLKDLKRMEYVNYFDVRELQVVNNGVCLNKGEIELNAVLNRISYPEPNNIAIQFGNEGGPGQVVVSRMTYDYTPRKGVEPTGNWEMDTVIAFEAGNQQISIKTSWNKLDLIGYPTTFKQFDEGFFNVYHYIHIDRLKKLNEILGNDTLKHYINKWESYTSEWPTSPIYKGVNHQPYN